MFSLWVVTLSLETQVSSLHRSHWLAAGGQQVREAGKGEGERGSLLPTDSGQPVGQVLCLFPLPDALASGGHTADALISFRPLLQHQFSSVLFCSSHERHSPSPHLEPYLSSCFLVPFHHHWSLCFSHWNVSSKWAAIFDLFSAVSFTPSRCLLIICGTNSPKPALPNLFLPMHFIWSRCVHVT